MKAASTEGKKQYGLISMVAMIIGTVVGSGIFLKNTSLIDTSHSAILSMVGWLIGGLVVLCMLMAFIEIMSITTNKGEQGTFTNWSRHLLGNNFSKIVSTYFTFIYFPLIMAGETIYGSQQLFSMSVEWNNNNPYLAWALVTLITLIIIVTAMVINSIFVKPGKIFSAVGTSIKLIPLFAIILFGVIVGLDLVSGLSTNAIFNPNDLINNIDGGGMSDNGLIQFKNIMLILPSVLFALDGFLYSSSLSTETKGKHTYRNAAVIAVGSITLIYILFSLSTFMLGDMSDGYQIENFSANAIIESFFLAVTGSQAIATTITWILSFIIFISIITASFNYTINTMWSIADTSAVGILNDYSGTLIKRNKDLNPQYAGFREIKYLFMWIAIIRFSDLGIMIFANETTWAHTFIITDFITNLASTINFTFYAAIIFGGMNNRRTKKHESDKLKGFFVFGTIGGVIIGGTSLYMFYGIFQGIISPYIGGSSTSLDFWSSLFELVIFVGLVLSVVLTAVMNDKKSKNRDEVAYGYKAIYIKNYEDKVVHVESQEAVRMDMFLKHKYFAKKDKLTIKDIEQISIDEVFGMTKHLSKELKARDINNIIELSKLDVTKATWINDLNVKGIEDNTKYIKDLITEAKAEIEIMKKPGN